MDKDIAKLGFENDFIGDLTNRETVFCSMTAQTEADKTKLFNAMNNPARRLGDEINQTIMAKDLYCEVVSVNHTDEKTGEVTSQELPRIVIIDKDGVGHSCVSIGVYSAIRKIIAIFGPPTWEKPLPIKVKQVSRGDRKMLTLEL